MNNFKNRVLDVAVVQINKHTDITARYEQHKTGRKITGFSFSYKKDAKAASKSCSQASELLEQKTLTAKQLGYYAKLLAESHWATQAKVLQGVNTKDVVTTLMEHLKRPEFFDKHKKLIEKLIKG